jgi:hypothetical protein
MPITESSRSYAEEYWRNLVLNLPPDALVEWRLGSTKDSCQSCIDRANEGPIAAAEFAERGIYPQALDLDCHGYNCRCFLTVSDAITPEETVGQLGQMTAAPVAMSGDAGSTLAAQFEQSNSFAAAFGSAPRLTVKDTDYAAAFAEKPTTVAAAKWSAGEAPSSFAAAFTQAPRSEAPPSSYGAAFESAFEVGML